MTCAHTVTTVETDAWGIPAVVCEDCGCEVGEVEDTRDFEAMAEARAERHRPAGADHRFGTW